jgi:hypothetical protein
MKEIVDSFVSNRKPTRKLAIFLFQKTALRCQLSLTSCRARHADAIEAGLCRVDLKLTSRHRKLARFHVKRDVTICPVKQAAVRSSDTNREI